MKELRCTSAVNELKATMKVSISITTYKSVLCVRVEEISMTCCRNV